MLSPKLGLDVCLVAHLNSNMNEEVTYEELVIEKRILNPKSAIEKDHEIIHIPLSEERIEVSLIPTVLEEVEIYKEQIEEVIQINEILKEEKIHIETVGDVKVTINDTQFD